MSVNEMSIWDAATNASHWRELLQTTKPATAMAVTVAVDPAADPVMLECDRSMAQLSASLAVVSAPAKPMAPLTVVSPNAKKESTLSRFDRLVFCLMSCFCCPPNDVVKARAKQEAAEAEDEHSRLPVDSEPYAYNAVGSKAPDGCADDVKGSEK